MPYTPERDPYIPGDPYSYDLKWLVSRIRRLPAELSSYGVPVVVSEAADMTDKSRIYVYTGTEAGYTAGDWYYYDPDAAQWTSGGVYGSYPVDSLLDPDSDHAVKNSAITAAVSDGCSIVPIYKGDVYNEAFGAFCKYGDYMFMIAPDNNSGNLGKLYVIDMANNVIDTIDPSVYCGHANSLTYSVADDAFYIAPVFYYDANDNAVATQQLIQYDSTFNTFNTINAPETIQGVGYDHVTGILYAYAYTGKLYSYINGTFDLVADIGVQTGYVQDIAVYNNMLYVESTTGLILKYAFKDGEAVLIKHYSCGCIDVSGKWQLGEYEGMDFDENGRLFCTNYINNPLSVLQAYALELPLNAVLSEISAASYPYNLYSDTTLISDATIDKFELGYNELRHVNQLMNMVTEPNTISYQATDNRYAAVRTVIRKPLTIIFSASSEYYTTYIYAQAPISINSAAGAKLITTDAGAVIVLDRQGALTLAGNALTFDAPTGLFAKMYTNYVNMLNVNVLPQFITPGTLPQWQTGGNNMKRALYCGLNVIAEY